MGRHEKSPPAKLPGLLNRQHLRDMKWNDLSQSLRHLMGERVRQ